MKKKNAFTLIELLAVIVILAIIALIATPIILGIIEDAKKDAFLRSVELVVSTTDMDIGTKPYDSYYTYTITDGDISNLDIPIKNTDGMNGSIKYDKEGNTAYAVNNGKYCVVKEYEGQAILKDYDETCGYIDYPDNDCFVVSREIVDYEITDVDTCKSYLTTQGMASYANTLCSGGNLYGTTLKDILKQQGASATEAQKWGASAIYSDSPEVELADYVCTDSNIIVPSEINGNKILVISPNAFKDKNLVRVKISDGIQTIGNYAFGGNKLTNVEIPNSVKSIGQYAFQENQLVSITIPNSVTTIGWGAFWDNQLTSVVIPEGITTIEGSLFNNNKLTSVVIPDSVTSIGNSAFSGNQLTNIEIPDSVTSIGSYAFSGNQLTNIEIPDSVTSIGNYAFARNQLTSIVIPDSVTTIGDSAFITNKLTSVEIPDSVTTIEGTAFANNKLASIEIPDSVTSIGGGAFTNNQLPDDEAFIYARNSDGSIDNTTLISYGGKKRDDIVIPNSIKTIESEAFYNNQLTNIEIPSSVTSIGGSAFAYNQLTNIEIPDGVTTIGSYAFAYNQLTNVVLPNSITKIGLAVFADNKLASVEIPSGVTSIDYQAFMDNELTNIVIPNTVTSIQSNSFSNNHLPDSKAFIYKRNSDGSVDNTKIIGYGGKRRENVVIPDEVVSLGEGLFNQYDLKSVMLSSNVTTLGQYVFLGAPLTYGIINKSGNSLKFEYAITTNGSTATLQYGIVWNESILMYETYRQNYVPITQYEEETVYTTETTTITGYEINDKTACQNYFKSKEKTEKEATSICNNEMVTEYNDLTLTEYLITVSSNNELLTDLKNKNIVKTTSEEAVNITNYTGSAEYIHIPTTIGGKKVVGIKANAFANKGLKAVVIPHFVKTIEQEAFINNALELVIIGIGTETIGTKAFYKDATYNPFTYELCNTTGRSFDWGSIINGATGYNFEIGTVVNTNGDVKVVSEKITEE